MRLRRRRQNGRVINNMHVRVLFIDQRPCGFCVRCTRMWSELWTVRLKEVPRTHALRLVRAQPWPGKHGWEQTGDETQVLLMSDQLGLRSRKRHDSSFFRLWARMCVCVRKAGSRWESELDLSFCRWSSLHNIYKMEHISKPEIVYQEGGAVIPFLIAACCVRKMCLYVTLDVCFNTDKVSTWLCLSG